MITCDKCGFGHKTFEEKRACKSWEEIAAELKVVPAATQEQPAGSGAGEPRFRKVVEWLHQRMAAAQNLPYEEGDVCLECADAVRDELQPLMEAALKLAGSPRKVGEDGPTITPIANTAGFLPCGHSQWDSRRDCLICLQFAVAREKLKS